MPFQLKTFVFDEYTIRQLAPTGPGIYGLANAENWIYIGAAYNLEETLLGHLNELDIDIEQQNPTVFTWEKSPATDRAERKIALIQELKPLLLSLSAEPCFRGMSAPDSGRTSISSLVEKVL